MVSSELMQHSDSSFTCYSIKSFYKSYNKKVFYTRFRWIL